MTIRLHIQLPARAGLFRISDCEAEAVVTWPAEVFRAFLEYPKRQDSLSAIACYREEEGRGRVYCGVLILGEGREGGVFAYDCGQHFAYLPGAKAVVDSILEQAAEKIIRAVAANSTGGRWRLSFNALRDQMGLVVSQHNGTGAMLLERLRMRPEAAAAGMDSGGFTLRLCQEPCQKGPPEEERFSQTILCQVVEQGRRTVLLCEMAGPLPALLERAAARSAGGGISFTDALEQSIRERGGTSRRVYPDEADVLIQGLGRGGTADQRVVIDLDDHRIRGEYDDQLEFLHVPQAPKLNQEPTMG